MGERSDGLSCLWACFAETGERAFGYDIWTKYNTTEPVVEARYEGELNSDMKAKIAELGKTDPKAAQELYRSVSYHVDHGNGLDCYKVGPTLGGGTTALMAGDTIVYPYCYATQEILDNGPFAFYCETGIQSIGRKRRFYYYRDTDHYIGCGFILQ